MTEVEFKEADIQLSDGRTLHYYDVNGQAGGEPGLAVFWHHGTPNVGEPPRPLRQAAAARGIRWIGYDRPGYGGSTRHRGRTIAAAAADTAALADALGIDTFANFGHSGGATHALAAAALLPDRVLATACAAALAPYEGEGLAYFLDMTPFVHGELHAALRGPEAMEHYLSTTDFDPEMFNPKDYEALEGPWHWFHAVAARGEANGVGPTADDDLAFVRPWGFDVTAGRTPVLFLHGDADRVVPPQHGEWLARTYPDAELWLLPEDGHISVLTSGEAVLDWLVERARKG